MGGKHEKMDIPAPNQNQVDGYLVLLKPEQALVRWRHDLSRLVKDSKPVQLYLDTLHATFPEINPEHYRGIGRYPVERCLEFGRPKGVLFLNERAGRRLLEIYGPDPTTHWQQPPWFDEDLMADPEVAREILSLTDAPWDYEIIRVTRGAVAPTPQTVGFDIGYWGGDHFSLVADSMIMPRWHVCPEDELPSLQPWARMLNENMLLPTAAAAAEFRSWYMTKPWAETETIPDQFQLIRVDAFR